MTNSLVSELACLTTTLSLPQAASKRPVTTNNTSRIFERCIAASFLRFNLAVVTYILPEKRGLIEELTIWKNGDVVFFVIGTGFFLSQLAIDSGCADGEGIGNVLGSSDGNGVGVILENVFNELCGWPDTAFASFDLD